MAMLPLIFNMIRRNQALRFLINSPNPTTVEADPYNHDSDDFDNCGAMKSSLWEIETLRKHFHPDVSKLANRKSAFQNRLLTFRRVVVPLGTSDEFSLRFFSKPSVPNELQNQELIENFQLFVTRQT